MADFPPTIMSLALWMDTGPKVFCPAEKRGTKWKIAECRLEIDHLGDHVDGLQGVTWSN